MYTDDQWQELLPQIEKIALRVATRLNASAGVRDELLSEATSHISDAIKSFDPDKARFSTWCKTVLRNLCVSQIRKEAVRRTRQAKYGESVARGLAAQWRGGPEEIAEKPRFDLVEVLERHLLPTDRLLLATYAGVLADCGAEAVEGWCREAECADLEALRTVDALPKVNRKQALALVFGQKLSWVAQRIFRSIQAIKRGGIGRTEL